MPTVLHRLFKWSETSPQSPAQRYKANGEWKTLTAREFADRVYHLALFFEARGIGSRDVGAILAYNSPEWVQADLAIMLTGAKAAGLYPNSSAKDIHYILSHTEASLLAVQNKEYFRKITGPSGTEPLPSGTRLILVFDDDTSISPMAVAYSEALAEGRKIASDPKNKDKLKNWLDRIDPKAAAFLIYTSGTTGNPKGAILSHDNLVFATDAAIRFWNIPDTNVTTFSFLPLCHIAEKLQAVGVGITQHGCVNFATKFDNVGTELPEVQPTLLLCVPRLWEKMMEGVHNKVARSTGKKRQLAEWALGVGARAAKAKFSGQGLGLMDQLQHKLADKLVLGKVREALGLRDAVICASGAASLSAHVSQWFKGLGVEILEDFGQTESAGIICMTEPGVESSGTVGKPVPGMEFKIAEDGEILTRGRHVFLGYLKDDAATAQVMEGGWLHTGDLAKLNERGQVVIQGRKKDVLKTSGGKMIAPLPIEEKLKADPMISQVCMVGDGRKYLSALITLSESTLADLKSRGVSPDGQVFNTAAVTEPVKAAIDELNQSLAGYEQIKRFAVICREFSIADGEMTPTMKMKRNVIESRFRDVIDQMYSGS